MKKTALCALLVSALLAVLSACSRGPAVPPEATPVPGPAAASETEAVPETTAVPETSVVPETTAAPESDPSPDLTPEPDPQKPDIPAELRIREAPDPYVGTWKAVSGPEILTIEKDGNVTLDGTEALVEIVDTNSIGIVFQDPERDNRFHDLGSVTAENGCLILHPFDSVTDRFPFSVFYREGEENPAGPVLGSWFSLNGEALEISEEGSSFKGESLEITRIEENGYTVRIGRDGFVRHTIRVSGETLVSDTLATVGPEVVFYPEDSHPLERFQGTWLPIDGTKKALKIDLRSGSEYDGKPLFLSISQHNGEPKLSMQVQGQQAAFLVQEFDGCLGWQGYITDPVHWFVREGDPGPAARLAGTWKNTDPDRQIYGGDSPEDVTISADGKLTVNGEEHELCFVASGTRWNIKVADSSGIHGIYSLDKPDELVLYMKTITCPMKRKS